MTDTHAAELHRDAELMRLARVLGTEPAELEFLELADEKALCELRLAVSDRMFALASADLRKAAALADKIPAGLAAKLSEHALGPVLSARTVPLLDVVTVSEIAQRMPHHFLAECAVHLDLRHAAPLIVALPVEKLKEAGVELARRREFIVLAAFVGYMREEVLSGLLSSFDSETVLQAGFLVEEPERVDALVSHLSDRRVDELLRAAEEHNLWEEALAIYSELGERQQGRMIEGFSRFDDGQLEAFATSLKANKTLRAAAKPAIAQLAPEIRKKISPGR